MDNIFKDIDMSAGIKSKLFFDIETMKALDYMSYFRFKEPRKNKDGTFHKSDLSREQQEEKWEKECCVLPLAGQVAMVGWISSDSDNYMELHQGSKVTEEDILKRFWQCYITHDLVVGFDIKRFDMPYLITRSRKYSISIPHDIVSTRGYLEDKIVDLRLLLSCGDKNAYGDLNDWCVFFDLEEKDNEVSKNFGEIFETHPERAIRNNRIEVQNIQKIFNIING